MFTAMQLRAGVAAGIRKCNRNRDLNRHRILQTVRKSVYALTAGENLNEHLNWKSGGDQPFSKIRSNSSSTCTGPRYSLPS